jgi:hypothetical protein
MLTKELGAFQHLPMVMCANDLLPSAIKKAKNVGPTKGNSLSYVFLCQLYWTAF